MASFQFATVPHCVAEWVRNSCRRRRAGIAFGAGALSVLAFAPVFASPILFLTLPVLVLLIDSRAGPRAAAWDGWWFGFGYFFFNLFWIGEAFLVEAEKFAVLLPFAVTLLPAGLALFWAAAAALAQAFWRDGFARVLVLAIALSIAEWLRGHLFTGLPWNVIGYALTYPLTLMQSAALIGAYGLTPLAIVIFTAPLVLIANDPVMRRATFLRAVAIFALPVAALWAYGTWRLTEPQTFLPNVKIRVVQPSVPQREKWLPEFQRRIFEDHLALSVSGPNGVRDDLAGITHLVWPEAAMPFLPLETPDALAAIGAMLPDGRSLITGAIRREAAMPSAAGTIDAKIYNGLIVLNDTGGLSSLYDKIHLVPFGEYLPFEPVLSALGLKKLTHGRGSFTPGPMPRPLLDIPGLPPTMALVCYEVLFPGTIVQGTERPGLLINVTNDGWFGNTTGPRQHFHQTRVRAVEEGLPLIRAANNGISAVIDAQGRVLQSLGLDAKGVIDSAVPAATAPPPYARFGDLGAFILLLILGAVCLLISKPKPH